MGKYRVYEVAEELGIETKQLILMLREMDVPVRSHMSTVDDGAVARLHARLERERRQASSGSADESRAAPARRRRRRRVAAPKPVEPEVAEEVTGVEAEEPVEIEIAAAEPDEVPAIAAEAAPDETPEVAWPAETEQAAAPQEEVTVVEPAAEVLEAVPEEAVAEEPGPVTEVTAEKATPKRRPRPVRRDLPAPAAPAAPAASAGPGGTVRIQAEGYTVDGRRKSRRDKRKQRRVDQGAVKENVKKTLAALGGGTGKKRRRDSGPSRQEVERERLEQEREVEKTRVRVNEFLTVAELADLIDSSAQQIITSAFKNLGLMVTINQRLDFDQIELICEEFGFEAVREQAYEADIVELEVEEVTEADLQPRAPVVTVMGHVDHGKTSLLDYVRKTNVIAGESGSITQHIGAYHVELGDSRSVTFLDTPGHEAFTAMRARGAELTDVVILVVAADDAVMPQTVEAISHAKNAGVPIVVAINKIDLPSAQVMKVKRDLLSHDVILEDFGGQVLSAEVSAKTGQGIDDLLEKVLLQAELLELRAAPEGHARGIVIEAELDRGMGPVATVLVQTGTLNVGDDFICGLFGGRVRALLDERGNAVESAGPAVPVRVLGLEGVPQAGDSLVELSAERAREIATRRQQLEREKEIRRRSKGMRLEDVFDEISAGRSVLNLVIKGDTDGSMQALSDSLEQLSTNEVAVKVIHRGVGAITESDVLLAATGRAAIIGFHVRPNVEARTTAERDGVDVRTYSVIYEAVEDVRLALEGMLTPEEREVIVGTAEVRQLFRIPKVGTVGGCYVSDGTIKRNLPVRILRDHVQIYEGEIDSLKRFKDDVREVAEGYECGISIVGYNDLKVGDLIEAYRVEEIARTLAESGAS